MRVSFFIFTSATFLAMGCTPEKLPTMSGHDHGQMMQGGQDVGKYLPSDTISPDSVNEAGSSEILSVKNGETIDLSPMVVMKKINGKKLVMFGYNGQIPGPMIKAEQGSVFYVNVTNKIPLPTTNHWHGLRLDSAFDGMPGISQPEILPGGSFRYTVKVPDSGLYWYHPHVREDIEQDLGLYGNILVTPKNAQKPPVDKEETVILDDILLNAFGGLVPYGKDGANYTMMGRYGNTFLLNGDTKYSLSTQRGDVVRFYLTNMASARPFRISFENARMKIIGSDGGPYQKEEMADSLIIGPAERYIIDVLFDVPGKQRILNTGSGSPQEIGIVMVQDTQESAEAHTDDFSTLHIRKDALLPLTSLSPYLSAKPDHTLRVSFEGMEHRANPAAEGIEWEDTMPMMNAMSNDKNMKWKFIDDSTGKANMDIMWTFKKGTFAKIRVINDDESMQHPVHFHGQHFLILDVDGKKIENNAWKDTFLLRTGETADILVYMNNPGQWMFHCHISEHLQSGMMGMFSVE